MPFSVQVNTADKAGAATAPVSATGSAAADTQANSLGDTFAALLQAYVPAGQASNASSGAQGAKPLQPTGAPDAPLRTRKSAADAPDPATAQLMAAQLPVPVALPSISGDSTEPGAADPADDTDSTSQPNTAAAQSESPDSDAGAATDLPASANPVEQTKVDSQSVQELVRAFSPGSTTAAAAGTSPATQHPAIKSPFQQQPAGQANTNAANSGSASRVAQVSHLPHTAASAQARTGDGPASDLRTSGQQPPRADAQRSTANVLPTFAGATSPLSRETLSNTVVPQPSSTSAATALVPPAVSNNAQDAITPSTMQDGYASQAAPALLSMAQTSGGDASSGSQDGADDAPVERKSSQGTFRLGTSMPEGDTRVGMSGWVGTTRTSSEAPAQPTGTEAGPAASSGMTTLGLDRIEAQSSARRLTNALRSDMSFGVQTSAFGRVNIQTALHGDQLASQISLEHAHVNASSLAAHMPGLEFTLGEKYKLDATVTVQNSGTAMSGGTQDSSARRDDQQNTGSSPQRLTPAGAVMAATTTFPTERQPPERLAPAVGRLDLLI